MPRRHSSFVTTIARIERAAAADQRRRQRQAAAAARFARQQYLTGREAEVAKRNDELSERLDDLKDILNYVLAVAAPFSFNDLRLALENRPYAPPAHLSAPVPAPKPPSFFSRLLPGADQRFQRAIEQHQALQESRRAGLESAWQAHTEEVERESERVRQLNQRVDELEAAYHRRDPHAVNSFASTVLEQSKYPDGFPSDFRLGYSPESHTLVVDYELPLPAVIPSVAQYVYVKSRDAIDGRPRKPAEIKDLYQDVISATTLRTLYELFESNDSKIVTTIVLSGFVRSIDPSTGKDIQPYLISVRTTSQEFRDLDLRRVDARACLRHLGAQVSARPNEMLAVRPIVDFNMFDKRFVAQTDLLGALDERPNLMDLNPSEFEQLVSNLFSKMGLESKLTRTSRDGGVDAVAFDKRPVLGGKVVIQAKRYRHTVGVSAVRDLYGTMINEGANKGILVTTSGYGPDAFEFAKDKPIELLDGANLLYLLKDVGIEARIDFPPDET